MFSELTCTLYMIPTLSSHGWWHVGIRACSTRAVSQRPRPGDADTESRMCLTAARTGKFYTIIPAALTTLLLMLIACIA